MKRLLQNHSLLLAISTVLVLPVTLDSGTLATEILIFSLAALGCNLLLGYAGLLSFGQGIFLGVGSYIGGLSLIHLDVSLLSSLVLASAIGAVTALVVGWFSIRRRGTYFVMLTFAFAQMFYFLAYSLKDVTGGDDGLLNIPRADVTMFDITIFPTATPWQYYSFVAVVFVVIFWGLRRIVDSVFGRTLLAIRDNEERASAVGYDIGLFKLAAFVISGAITGLAGGLHAVMAGMVALANIDLHASESILIMTVLGGAGNLYASVLGAAFYVLSSHWLSALWPRWLMLLGFLLIAVSLYMHKGIYGMIHSLLSRVKLPQQNISGEVGPGREVPRD